MNLIAWLEFELTEYDVEVQHINHYSTGTGSSRYFLKSKIRVIHNCNSQAIFHHFQDSWYLPNEKN